MTKFKLGQEVKDKVTGFKGVILGHAIYLTGCDQYEVQPTKCEKGVYPDDRWFDEGRLALTSNKQKITKADIQADDNGCDCTPAPSK